MDNIRLTWDLTIIIIFAIIMAYSFIIGRNVALKVVIATYMAMLAADGIGNIFQAYLMPASPALEGERGLQVLILLKIVTFILGILILTIRGGFKVDLMVERSLVTRMLSNLTFGFLSAGLMVSTLLVYLTGGSFLQGAVIPSESMLYYESQLIQSMINGYNVWFALPAIAIVFVSFFEPREGA